MIQGERCNQIFYFTIFFFGRGEGVEFIQLERRITPSKEEFTIESKDLDICMQLEVISSAPVFRKMEIKDLLLSFRSVVERSDGPFCFVLSFPPQKVFLHCEVQALVLDIPSWHLNAQDLMFSLKKLPNSSKDAGLFWC